MCFPNPDLISKFNATILGFNLWKIRVCRKFLFCLIAGALKAICTRKWPSCKRTSLWSVLHSGRRSYTLQLCKHRYFNWCRLLAESCKLCLNRYLMSFFVLQEGGRLVLWNILEFLNCTKHESLFNFQLSEIYFGRLFLAMHYRTFKQNVYVFYQ